MLRWIDHLQSMGWDPSTADQRPLPGLNAIAPRGAGSTGGTGGDAAKPHLGTVLSSTWPVVRAAPLSVPRTRRGDQGRPGATSNVA